MIPQTPLVDAGSAEESASWPPASLRVRKVGRFLGTFLLAALIVSTALLLDLVAIGGAPRSNGPDGGVTNWFAVGFLAAIPIAFSLLWRNRAPWIVLALQAVGAVVFATSGVGAVLVLPSLLARKERSRTPTRMVLAILAAGVIIAVGALMEFQKDPIQRMFMSEDPLTGQVSTMTWWGYVIAGITVIALAVAWGLVRRYRSASVHAEQEAAVQTEVAQTLRGEVSRQQERELIASEMHDTVAHQLSLVSLHAAALQVTTVDPAAAESARAIRGLGHQALEEMRVLISSLRDSESSGYTGPSPTLKHLPGLIREAQDAGVKLDARLNIDGEENASDALTRAVYRITQEALTNAIRYGTGQWVKLAVTARMGEGVVIEVKNPMTAESSAEDLHGSTGAGIPGMEQRAQTLAGSLTVGPQKSVAHGSEESMMWVVQAHIPWSRND